MELKGFTDQEQLSLSFRYGGYRNALHESRRFVRDSQLAYSEIVDYEECVAAHHSGVEEAMENALEQLGRVMGADAVKDNEGQRTSWHFHEREADDGTKIPVAYEVTVAPASSIINRDSYYRGNWRSPVTPLQITTHALHRLPPDYPDRDVTWLKGEMTGLALFRNDGIQTSLSQRQVYTKKLEDLKDEVTREIVDEAITQLIEQELLKEYMQLPSPTGPTEKDVLRHTKLASLIENPDLEDQYLELLSGILRQGLSATLLESMKNYSPALLDSKLSSSGADQRFYWLVENAPRLERRLAEIKRHAIAFGFKDKFLEHLEAEKSKVAEIAETATALATLRSITTCLSSNSSDESNA